MLCVICFIQTHRWTTPSLNTHRRGLHQPPLAAEISGGQRNEAFSPELSRAYKGSGVHPGGLHWRPKINTALYTSSIYSSTSPTIYLLLSSAFSRYSSLAGRVRRQGSFLLLFMFLLPFYVKLLSYLYNFCYILWFVWADFGFGHYSNSLKFEASKVNQK